MEYKEVIWDSQHCFSRRKSCPTNVATLYDGVTTSVDKERAAGVIYLDSVRTCPSHNILPSKLERDGFDGSTVSWIWSWLDSHIQRVVVNGSDSEWTSVTSSVPQGSILRSVLFNIFINYIDEGIKCNPSKFLDEDRDPRDLNKLRKWALGNLIKFKTGHELAHAER
ncbi:rna-directed dna polymerase from mobile element jockey-like [Willisornis vidua]|uniref:Rna-directed dna polymerase from mobile element jockey-like n=1 Tax=Willisornis vidua TaxID=1566151 RepID=A0ABQ9CWS1_9PASS|nr:rna-directed dna polymerase from mobile element jockey-like [Willisornis vidua]